MKNLTEQDIRAAVLEEFQQETTVEFKLLVAQEDFDMFPYYFVKGKQYKLWICAYPDNISSMTIVAIPGLEGIKSIPTEVFGDFSQAVTASDYAMYAGGIPVDYSGFKYEFCKNKEEYKVIRNFDKGLQLIPEWYLDKQAIISKVREQYANSIIMAYVKIFGSPQGEKKVCWEIYVIDRNHNSRLLYTYFDIADGEFINFPFKGEIKDNIPLQQHVGAVMVDKIEFKYDGQKLSWGISK